MSHRMARVHGEGGEGLLTSVASARRELAAVDLHPQRQHTAHRLQQGVVPHLGGEIRASFTRRPFLGFRNTP